MIFPHNLHRQNQLVLNIIFILFYKAKDK